MGCPTYQQQLPCTNTPDKDPSIVLTIRFRAMSRRSLIYSYFPDVMPGGMFIRTVKDPSLTLGSHVKLRFQLIDGRELFACNGVIAWMQQKSDHLGVGIHFLNFSRGSFQIFKEMLTLKEAASTVFNKGNQPSTDELEEAKGEFSEMPTNPCDPQFEAAADSM